MARLKKYIDFYFCQIISSPQWMSNCLQEGSVKINAKKWLSAQLMPHKAPAIDWHHIRDSYLQHNEIF